MVKWMPAERQTFPNGDADREPATSHLPLYWLKWLGVLVMLALTACCGLWVHHTFLGTNFHAVVPGKIYRSAQLEAETLAEIVRRYGLRSVINLRGCCPEFDWYHQERQTLQSLNVRQYDIRFSYRAPPPVPELRNLVQVLSDCEKPVLLHCRRGADRTGLASAIALICENESLEVARKQLSPFYGWFPAGGPERLAEVLDWYADWLKKLQLASSREVFALWVREHYKPGHLWAELEPLSVPDRWRVGETVAARFRVHNRSDFCWRFRITPRVGVHLRAWLLPGDIEVRDPAELAGLPSDAAGFFNTTVAPRESLEITLPLPRSDRAGKFVLLVDLVDAHDGPFGVYGSPTFRRWVTVE
jgi:protein tyrosine phosphatase (PTP) superfamily phosphohydrolase (DUF442 family)